MFDGKLKIYFGEILNRYSQVSLPDGGRVLIKHFAPLDLLEVDYYFEQFRDRALAQKLPTNDEQLAQLVQNGEWGPDKDKEMAQLTHYVNNLKITRSKLALKVQIDKLTVEIEANEKKLDELRKEKQEKIGLTVEAFAHNKVGEYYIFSSFYRTPTERLYSAEDFDEIDGKVFQDLVMTYNKFADGLNTQTLKKIALAPFFLNSFYLCNDNAYEFYGKPIVELSMYQTELFSYARYFKNIISNATTKPPEDVMKDPDKLIEWHGATKSAEETMSKVGDRGNVSLMGASKEDYKRLGLAGEHNVVNLADEAKKRGGKLNMNDLMKLNGS